MKIVKIDNYNRDYIPDVLICENINKYYGDKVIAALNINPQDSDYFILVEDTYVLREG